MKKTGRILLRILILIILFLFSFVAVYPLIFLLGGSLKSTPELGNNLAALWSADRTLHWTWLPFEPTLRHYMELLLDEPGYYVMFWNSVKIVGGVIGGQLLLSLPAAWGFARWQFPGKKILLSLYIVLMLFPFQVLMLSEYLVLNRMGMIDTLWALILPGVCSTFPVFIMYRFFSKLSKDVIEASTMDGCNVFQQYRYIKLPLVKNIFSIVIVMLVNGCLKTFDVFYILDNKSRSTEMVATYMYKTAFNSADFGYGSTLSVFLVIECLVAVGIIQKCLGSAKGDGSE